MTRRTKQDMNYSQLLSYAEDALDDSPALTLLTQQARRKIAGLAQRALLVHGESGYSLKDVDAPAMYYLIRKELRESIGMSVFSERAIGSITSILTDALTEERD